jgi:hypothetical protein
MIAVVTFASEKHFEMVHKRGLNSSTRMTVEFEASNAIQRTFYCSTITTGIRIQKPLHNSGCRGKAPGILSC